MTPWEFPELIQANLVRNRPKLVHIVWYIKSLVLFKCSFKHFYDNCCPSSVRGWGKIFLLLSVFCLSAAWMQVTPRKCKPVSWVQVRLRLRKCKPVSWVQVAILPTHTFKVPLASKVQICRLGAAVIAVMDKKTRGWKMSSYPPSRPLGAGQIEIAHNIIKSNLRKQKYKPWCVFLFFFGKIRTSNVTILIYELSFSFNFNK